MSRGLVSSLEVINRSKVRVHLRNPIQSSDTGAADNGQLAPPSHGAAPYQFTIGSLESFESLLIQTQDELGIPPSERVPVSYRDEISTFQTLLHLAPTVIIGGLLLWGMRRSTGAASGPGGGIFGVGKSRAKLFNKDEQVSVRFKDVAGADEAKEVSLTLTKGVES